MDPQEVRVVMDEISETRHRMDDTLARLDHRVAQAKTEAAASAIVMAGAGAAAFTIVKLARGAYSSWRHSRIARGRYHR